MRLILEFRTQVFGIDIVSFRFSLISPPKCVTPLRCRRDAGNPAGSAATTEDDKATLNYFILYNIMIFVNHLFLLLLTNLDWSSHKIIRHNMISKLSCLSFSFSLFPPVLVNEKENNDRNAFHPRFRGLVAIATCATTKLK